MPSVIDTLTYIIVKPVLDDEMWRAFGYRRRPKHGSLWDKFAPKTVELENYVSRELVTLSTLDVLRGIKMTSLKKSQKAQLSINVLQNLFKTTHSIFETDDFLEGLGSTASSLESGDHINAAIVKRAQRTLSKKSLARYVVGIAVLMHEKDQSSFLLKSEKIAEMVTMSKFSEEFIVKNETEERKSLVHIVKGIAF